MALQAEAPLGVLTHMFHRQHFSNAALPAWLKQSLGVVPALRFHFRCETDVFWAMHHDFQLMAGLQKVFPRGAVAFRRKGDPVETPAQWIHPAGFQMQGEAASRIEALGEGL